jgi:Carboxypeptidase regulatory-like domain
MKSLMSQKQRWGAFLCAAILTAGLSAGPLSGAEVGKLAGTVHDTEGNPLMGATVFVIGPLFPGASSAPQTIARVITDAGGKFLLGDLVPGWYSLRVYSPTRLPAARNRIRVAAGETSEERFVLGDVFAPLRMKEPATKVSTWGDDWKWILRASASTRPILRYRKETQTAANNPPQPLPPAQRLIGVMPVSGRGESFSGDAAMGSVMAYFRPLSRDSDVLVAGSMTGDGLQASTLATAFRRNLKGDPQEITLTVHQLSFVESGPLAAQEGMGGMNRAQAMVISYAHSKRVTDAMTVTAGFEAEYLATATDAMTTQPFVTMELGLSPESTLTFQYGSVRPSTGEDLADRVGDLNAFPRIILSNFRPQLERLNHTEVSYERKLARRTRIRVVAYRDSVEHAAVWGRGDAQALGRLQLAGNFLPNAVVDGVTLNGGDYGSSGVRVAVVRSWGSNLEAAFAFSTGNALAVGGGDDVGSLNTDGVLRDFLSSRATQSFAGGITAKVPTSHTRVTASYQWLPRGRVTDVDPSLDSGMDIQPFLNVQIRQPLPTLAFLPAHIEAVADFHNLLAEGYVPLTASDDRLVLTPAYRSFRGGFSVQF